MAENPELEIPLQIKMGYNTSIGQGADFTKWLKDNDLTDVPQFLLDTVLNWTNLNLSFFLPIGIDCPSF